MFLFQHPLWFSDTPNPKLPFTGPPDAIAGSLKRAAEMGISMVDLVAFGRPTWSSRPRSGSPKK